MWGWHRFGVPSGFWMFARLKSFQYERWNALLAVRGHIAVVPGGAELGQIDGYDLVDVDELAGRAKRKELALEEGPRLLAGGVLQPASLFVFEEHADRIFLHSFHSCLGEELAESFETHRKRRSWLNLARTWRPSIFRTGVRNPSRHW